MKMKMLFTEPEIQVIAFSVADIITTSSGNDDDFPDVVLPDNETP